MIRLELVVSLMIGAAVATAASDPLTAAPERTVRFLEQRVESDPQDFGAHNRLAGLYLQRLRETGNLTYLELAARAVDASLAAVPDRQNVSGLALLAQVEIASHRFATARDHGRKLAELDPRKGYPWQILGDAELELGDYEAARDAFRTLAKVDPESVATETRLARLAVLRGDGDTAIRRYRTALRLANDDPVASAEILAWCHWQLGERAFAAGEYSAAERHARDSLAALPKYYRAQAALGRARAARGDLPGAIEEYERAIVIVPEPTVVAELGDLYELVGRKADAEAQFALVEKIALLSRARGVFSRQLAVFYADHNSKPEQAYEEAKAEYATRRDIYGADALAWTALKAGRIREAETAIAEALKLGTRDARLYYHAGMIARAAGHLAVARRSLKRALDLSPEFDPRQARIARRALAELGGPTRSASR